MTTSLLFKTTQITEENRKKVYYKCNGEYCKLISVFDAKEDLAQNKRDYPKKSIIENQIDRRSRAYKILEKVLTTEELLELENNGKITQLKIDQRIRSDVFRSIPKSCVDACKDNYRSVFLQLEEDEELDLWTEEAEKICSANATVEQKEEQDIDGTSCSSTVQVCETCYYTYQLLSQYRYITDSAYRREMTDSFESRFFHFDELEENTDDGFIPVKAPDQKDKFTTTMNSQQHEKSTKTSTKVKINLANQNFFYHPPAKNLKILEPARQRRKQRNRKIQNNFLIKDSGMKLFDYNCESAISYSILESDDDNQNKTSRNYVNMIVCHDIFDTYERMAIYWKDFLYRNYGHQILLWNYPGQAFTKFSEKQTLNNDYHAECLMALLDHIGPKGSGEFMTNMPFYILGHGHGGSVACLFAKTHQLPHLKALILVNPLSFVDTHIASILHDCRNVFSCCPEERPDLPVYFYSRFIFSDNYLKKITTPLALNLYTAVNNPITLRGRIRLCDGILKNTDVRTIASDIWSPIISIHGSESSFVRPLHAETFSERRLVCDSIQSLFRQKGKRSILITMPGGHELFQEKKRMVSTLIEQLLKGYFDSEYEQIKEKGINQSKNHQNEWIGNLSYDINPSERWGPTISRTVNEVKQNSKINITVKKKRKPKQICTNEQILGNHKSVPKQFIKATEKQGDTKAEEYMSWRLKRNKKRLSRFQRAAKVIQNSLRVFMARTMLSRLKRQTSATTIQRCYRGMLGRKYFNHKRKELWAATFVQRTYRGAMGRRSSYFKRICILSQLRIARAWRGFVDRKRIRQIIFSRHKASTYFQSLWRRKQSLMLLSMMKLERNSSTVIQRVYRGHLARQIAKEERKKYIFSVSQSRGIKIGRKLLVDYKKKAAKLQSELSILGSEKTDLSIRVNDITKDISIFESRAKELEKSMQDLSIIEVQQKLLPLASAKAAADISIRENKIQLDQEFSVVLTKITDRKNQLASVDGKLSQIEFNVREKQEQLKSLERKLVVLLESQENELDCIKKKQMEIENAELTLNKRGDETIQSKAEINVSEISSSIRHDQKTASLIDSTENMMKFGFSSMAMTYFTSLNMVRAMKSITMNDDVATFNHKTLKYSHGRSDISGERCNYSDLYSISTVTKQLSTWSVDDVVAWLKVLSLHQYEDAFRDGAVDGPFLSQLTEDDLQNILGVEHKLHRKKIMFGIEKLGASTTLSSTDQGTAFLLQDDPQISQLHQLKQSSISREQSTITTSALERDNSLSLEDLSRYIRNNKHQLVKEALCSLNDTKFEQIDLRVQFLDGIGTVYKKHVSDLVFHINKSDEHGNTLMHVAAQNGNMKIAKLLISKGSNPNHQNKQGQTPGHFAVAYQFYDFASWLFDEEGGGGDDLLVNIYGLGPYDGLNQS